MQPLTKPSLRLLGSLTSAEPMRRQASRLQPSSASFCAARRPPPKLSDAMQGTSTLKKRSIVTNGMPAGMARSGV